MAGLFLQDYLRTLVFGYQKTVYRQNRHHGRDTMRMEIAHFDGCPTYLAAEKTLREVLEEQGIAAEVELVAVSTDGEAQELRFAGSPTIRVDSEDLFPVAE